MDVHNYFEEFLFMDKSRLLDTFLKLFIDFSSC